MMPIDATLQEMTTPVEELAAALRRAVSPGTVVRANEALARRTTLRVGGRADLWVEPADEPDLSAVLAFADRMALPVMVIGRGSNLLIRDGGIRGLVLHLGRPGFAQVRAEGDRMRCGAGARLKAVAVEARKHGLSGLEFLEGIPGSVGGALRMNAGAHGSCVFDAVIEIRSLDRRGTAHVTAGSSFQAGYRSCPMLASQIAVEALLAGRPAPSGAIGQCMKEFNRKRWSTQPAAPSAGCVFKNPDSIPAGKLVDELGLKGMRIGGAMVSLEHGNFIVTDGSATASDVLRLIGRIQQEAKRARGIDLCTEVQIVGEEAEA